MEVVPTLSDADLNQLRLAMLGKRQLLRSLCRSSSLGYDDGQRATRRTCAGLDNQPTSWTVLNSDSPKLFRRLRGVVDSDGSDSEEKQRTGKHALSTCPEKQYTQENSRKRRRLNSSSDEDSD